ncbi:hypothetical protein ACFZBU_15120 [Embleya sp. NPDC008237]|uniref:hypothetical protein n=1 Tax=Embleya sp. NPDC008237 TaxID=3363978 RepID=UPI0036E786F2
MGMRPRRRLYRLLVTAIESYTLTLIRDLAADPSSYAAAPGTRPTSSDRRRPPGVALRGHANGPGT